MNRRTQLPLSPQTQHAHTHSDTPEPPTSSHTDTHTHTHTHTITHTHTHTHTHAIASEPPTSSHTHTHFITSEPPTKSYAHTHKHNAHTHSQLPLNPQPQGIRTVLSKICPFALALSPCLHQRSVSNARSPSV